MSYLIQGCACASVAYNPGLASCVPVATRDAFKIYVSYYDSTGAINKIPAGTVINEAYITAKLNNTDPKVRWYIAPKIENNTPSAPEMETESIGNQTFSTGEEIKQAETFEHVRKDAHPSLIGFYDSIACMELGEFSISRSGQLKGLNDGEGNLIPKKLQDGSLNASYVPALPGQTQRVMVTRTDDELENDAFVDFIDVDQIAYPALKWRLLQPIELTPYIISATTSSIIFKLQTAGSVGYKAPATGFVTADLVSSDTGTTGQVYNVSEDNDAAGTLTYNATLQQYTFTYGTAVTSGDEIILKIVKTKYHMQNVSIVTS